MKYLIAMILVLPMLANAQLATCIQSCSEQSFNVDPFANETWYSGKIADSICSWEWDSANSRLKHIRTTVGTAPCNTFGYAKYRGNIARDGCASYRVVSATPVNTRLGFVLRADEFQTLAQNHYSVFANKNGTTATVHADSNYTNLGPNISAVPTSDCLTWSTVSDGDWIGVCVRGTQDSTVINLFHLGASDPGPPLNTDGGDGPGGGAGWGVAECSFTGFSCDVAGSNIGCDDSGNSFGIYSNFFSATDEAAVFDNFKTYSCM